MDERRGTGAFAFDGEPDTQGDREAATRGGSRLESVPARDPVRPAIRAYAGG